MATVLEWHLLRIGSCTHGGQTQTASWAPVTSRRGQLLSKCKESRAMVEKLTKLLVVRTSLWHWASLLGSQSWMSNDMHSKKRSLCFSMHKQGTKKRRSRRRSSLVVKNSEKPCSSSTSQNGQSLYPIKCESRSQAF